MTPYLSFVSSWEGAGQLILVTFKAIRSVALFGFSGWGWLLLFVAAAVAIILVRHARSKSD